MDMELERHWSHHQDLEDGNQPLGADAVAGHVDLLDVVVAVEDGCDAPASAVEQPVVVDAK
eukprot:768820-Hanusia_phi.AAC.7